MSRILFSSEHHLVPQPEAAALLFLNAKQSERKRFVFRESSRIRKEGGHLRRAVGCSGDDKADLVAQPLLQERPVKYPTAAKNKRANVKEVEKLIHRKSTVESILSCDDVRDVHPSQERLIGIRCTPRQHLNDMCLGIAVAQDIALLPEPPAAVDRDIIHGALRRDNNPPAGTCNAFSSRSGYS